MRSISEVGRALGRLAKDNMPHPFVKHREDREGSLTAPAGTNAFLRQYVGTNIQEIGKGKLMVRDKQCRGGVCAGLLYMKRHPDGTDIFLHAHIQEDDSMEIAIAYRDPEGDHYRREYLDFNTTLQQVKEDLIQSAGESPQTSLR